MTVPSASDASKPVLLVVEDNESVREAVALVLSGQGYEVASTNSGEEAIDLISVCSHLDGLYTDIQLGGVVTGWKVGEIFHRKWPTKPIVYASAASSQNAHLEPTAVFLPKPFQWTDLIEVLKTVPELGSEGAKCQS
jgi:CheY-like chemotaxis protein